MTPRSRLTPETLQKRIQCYENGQTTTHWPEEANVPSARRNHSDVKYTPIVLSPEQKELIPLE